jgi:hypothetical protein
MSGAIARAGARVNGGGRHGDPGRATRQNQPMSALTRDACIAAEGGHQRRLAPIPHSYAAGDDRRRLRALPAADNAGTITENWQDSVAVFDLGQPVHGGPRSGPVSGFAKARVSIRADPDGHGSPARLPFVRLRTSRPSALKPCSSRTTRGAIAVRRLSVMPPNDRPRRMATANEVIGRAVSTQRRKIGGRNGVATASLGQTLAPDSTGPNGT